MHMLMYLWVLRHRWRSAALDHFPFPNKKQTVVLETASDFSLLLRGLEHLPEDGRLHIRILWNAEVYDYLYLFYENQLLYLSCLHGSRHFFDDYYDLSSQIVKDKIVVFPENGILRIDSKLLRPPVDFDTGLINIAIQKQAYLCIYHTVSQGREHLLHGYHAT